MSIPESLHNAWWQSFQEKLPHPSSELCNQWQHGLFLSSPFKVFLTLHYLLSLEFNFFFLFYLCLILASMGMLPLFSSRAIPVPASESDVKGTSPESNVKGASEDKPKPCCGCLGRDTIANAAAHVGPAVVNISVPHGI